MRTILTALAKGKLTILAVVAALTLALASAALGADGDFFRIGQSNFASSVSKLIKTGAGPALDLQVGSGPPLKVNSSAKVVNLNADRLDDKDSTQLAPILRAQQDATSSGIDVSGTQQINSLSINAPVSGVLMISGTAFVNSREASPADYILNPKLDGSNVTPSGWGAYFTANSSGNEGSRFELSYTVSQPVSAGTHTVTQELGGYFSSPAFFYNNNELSVMFVPGSQASVSNAAALAAAQDSGLTPSGERK